MHDRTLSVQVGTRETLMLALALGTLAFEHGFCLMLQSPPSQANLQINSPTSPPSACTCGSGALQ